MDKDIKIEKKSEEDDPILKKNKVGRPHNCKRCRYPKTQCKCGRPTKVTPDAIAKLEQAFSIGATDSEACSFADISVDTLYSYQRKNPNFIKRKEALREKPLLLARQTVVRGLQSDHDHALRFLERKIKHEFSPRSEVAVDGTIGLIEKELCEIADKHRVKK